MGNEVILVVEDNERNRRLVRDLLTFKGYEIVEAETGEDGVRLAQERRPKLILVDIRLPGIDGIEALRRLRDDAATATIPVMAMTASVMTSERQKIMAAGFDAYQSSRSTWRSSSRRRAVAPNPPRLTRKCRVRRAT